MASNWLASFVIGWSKYRLGLPSAPLHYGLTWPVGIPTVFQTQVTGPSHSPNGRGLWKSLVCCYPVCYSIDVSYLAGDGSRRYWIRMTQKQSQIAKFMGPTWGPPGSSRPQMGPMLAPWTLLSGSSHPFGNHAVNGYENGQDMGFPLTKFIDKNNLKLVLQELWQKEQLFFMTAKLHMSWKARNRLTI